MLSKSIVFMLFAVNGLVFAQTKPPAPVLMGEPILMEKSITLRISNPGEGQRVVVRMYRDRTEDTDIQISPQVTDGEIELQLKKGKELKAGEVLTFTQTIGSVESLASSAYRVPEIQSPEVQILSASGFLAYNVIPVTFKAKNADGLTLTVCQEEKCLSKLASTKLDGDGVKSGKAEIKLPSAPDSTKSLYLNFSADRKGAKATVGTQEVLVEGLAFRLERAPKEGDQEIKGRSAEFIKKMVVFVYGGAPVPSRIEKTTAATATATGKEALAKAIDRFASRNGMVILKRTSADPGRSAKGRSPQKEEEEEADLDFAANDLRDELFQDSATIEKGAFTFTLKQRLDAGQRLVLCSVIDNDPGLGKYYCDGTNVIVQSVAVDFGRLRAYFSTGTVISAGNNSFGKADPYIAFNSDFAFINRLIDKKNGGSDPCQSLNCLQTSKFGISLHGFLDIRLTQAATESKTAATLGPTPQQAGVFQAGFYMPMRFAGMDWVYRGTQYSAYFAPLAKFGVTHLKDGVVLGKRTSTTTTTVEDLTRPGVAPKVTPGDEKVTPNASNNPLPFFGYGLRMGMMRYELMGRTLRNRQIAPDNVAYVDVTYGQNGIYRRAVDGPTVDPVTQVVTDNMIRTTSLTRTRNQSNILVPGFNVEGRLKLPYLPAQVGMDLFFHRRLPTQSTTTDFRFILGFRVDVAKAMGRVFGATP